MRRTVTRRTAKLSYETIRVVAKAIAAGKHFLTYAELAQRLGTANQTGQGLTAILNEAARKCREHDLPDVSAVIVTKSSMDMGRPMPSEDSFDENGYWAISGLHRSEVPGEQQRVHSFNWKSVKQLRLMED